MELPTQIADVSITMATQLKIYLLPYGIQYLAFGKPERVHNLKEEAYFLL